MESNNLGENYKWFFEDGDCRNGIESTIIGFEDDELVLYRFGAISIEEIEKVIGKIIIRNKKEIATNVPVMLLRHYDPNTPTYL